MADVQALIEQGKAAIKAGQKAQAKAVLQQAVDEDETNEQAWLWLSACVDTVVEQQICLENVIAINPNNEKAKKGLAAITSKAPSKPATPAAPPPPPPPAPAPAKPASPAFPTDGYGDFGDPFAGTGFTSNPYGASTDPALDSQWDSFGADSSEDSFSSIPTSVDWGRESGAAAYGSGKEVAQPSPDEYDSWVSNLSLGGASTTPETDFNPASGPFGSDSFDFDNFSDAPSTPSASDLSAPVSTNVSPFDDFDFSSFDAASSGFGSPFDAPGSSGPFSADPASVDLDNVADPFGSGFGKTTSPVQNNNDDNDDPFGDAANIDLDSDPFANLSPDATRSMFGASRPAAESANSNAFGNSRATVFGGALPEKQEASGGGFAFIDSNTAPTKEAYFSAIPPEIQADGPVEKPSTGLMLTVGALAVLNVLSIAFLFLNLTKH